MNLFWRHMGGDCPETRHKFGAPVHGWSSDMNHADMAMPDFTFEEYKDIHSADTNPAWTSNSWPEVAERLHEVVRKGRQKRGFMWRGQASSSTRVALAQMIQSGPPPRLDALLQKRVPKGVDVKIMNWEGAGHDRSDFVSLYDQCKWKYTFHVPGHHYSAMIKYKLACNQTVFMVGDGKKLREEFWYQALEDKTNIFFIRDDLSDLWEVIEGAFKTPDLAARV